MYCDTKRFPTLTFCGPYLNPHGTKGLSNNYHFCFDPKIGHGICAILRIPVRCVACTSMLDKLFISDILSKKQARYQPVANCTY